MQKFSLAAQQRPERKKQAAKRLRRLGRVPAVVYGGDEESVAVSVDARDLHAGLHTELGSNTVFDLDIEGSGCCDVVVRQISRDPLTGSYVHVDLIRIDESQKMVCKVPLEFVGTPAGVRLDGGVLQKYANVVELHCAPTEVPTSIRVDISELLIGHALHFSDLDTGGLEALIDLSRPVASVHPPRVHLEEEEGEEGAEEGEAAEGTEAEAGEETGEE